MMSEDKIRCACNGTVFKEYHKHCKALDRVVEYVQCESCGMIIAPKSTEYNLSHIYNADYSTNVDYGWKGRAKRLYKYIRFINLYIPLKKKQICDFGAGNGCLGKLLISKGFNVLAYEPFIQNNTILEKSYYRNAPFDADVLLMVEVFEHFTNAFEEISKILTDFHNPELVIFTTYLTDNATKPIDEWWYLDPDGGHFTFWSRKSLTILGEINGYKLISLNPVLHIFCKASDRQMCNSLRLLSIPTMFAMKISRLPDWLFK